MGRIEATLLRLTTIGLLAVSGACRSAEIARPSAQLTPAMYPVELLSSRDTSPATQPPDVPTAKAGEAAALDRIASHVAPDYRDHLLAKLQEHRPDTISYIAATADPELSKLISAYYRVRAARVREEWRQKSVDSARSRPIGLRVTITLGHPPAGAVALVLRRRLVDPFDVIVLGPDATAEILNAALMRFDESRAYDGDDLFFGQTLVVAEPRPTNASPYRAQLDSWIAQLRQAAPIAVAEIGNVRAIQIHSALLR